MGIYVFLGVGNLGGQGVDARSKSGQGVFTVVSRVTPLDRTSSELLNRTAVGLTGPSALSGAIVPVPVDARIKSGHDG